MTPKTLQYRFLQVVTNHVADERVTVGLLHWDGSELRVVVNGSRVPDTIPSKLDLLSVLRALKNSLEARARGLTLGLSLDDLSPVPVGETGFLSWGALRVAQSENPQNHFDYLATSLGLGLGVKAKKLARVEPAFAQHAEVFAQRIDRPDLIQARKVLKGLADHESPLSWRNGVWHHTFPLDLRASDIKGLGKRLEATLGKIDASVPREQVGVVVLAVHEKSDALQAALASADEYIVSNLAGRVETVQTPILVGEPDFSALDARVLSDIRQADPCLRVEV